jgi:hypothetical protein
VYLRSSSDPAQSASENLVINNELDLTIFKPIRVQDFKYLRILLTNVQCVMVGACKN